MTRVNHLIDFFVPEHYEILLNVDRQQREFNGKVLVTGRRTNANSIRLHAKSLEIHKVLVDNKASDYEFGDNDELIITGDSAGDETTNIYVEFKGNIIDGSMHGLYPCFYEIDGQKRELLATQFESHHAREVFPCVDEPAAKATFDVTLVTEQNVVVLGNMPPKSENPDKKYGNFTLSELDDKKVTCFQTTPKMSTYLLAFVIGDFIKTSGKTKTGTEVNIYATPAQDKKSLDFALDVAIKAIDFYNEYFDVNYPLPKSDHVALPDFSSGAMENWGLITYRENALLAEDNTSIASKQYIATVIAHELSHQWFGNLVTMKWWDDLWLNESFATLMEYVSVDAIWPEWNVWSIFETTDVITALRRDCLSGVQTVHQNVNHPDEISTLFDSAIVYAKGGRLLKMIRAYIGEEAFRDGLRNYFTRFAYKNTCGEDLWECLSETSGHNISKIMEAWLNQPGYPIVKLSFDYNEAKITQSRFLIDGQDSSQTWPIPLFASDKNAPIILDEKETCFPVTEPSTLRLNIKNDAHFITNYDEKSRHNLLTVISELSTIERLQIINESTLLARGRQMKTADIVDVLMAYENEYAEEVWSIMSYAIADLKRFTEGDEESRVGLRKLVENLSLPLYEKLGWTAKNGESENDTKLRPTIIGHMLFAENREVIDKALALYASHKHDLKEINGNIRDLAMLAAVKFGEESDFHELVDLYKISQDADLRSSICSALTASNRADDIDEMIEMLTNSEIIRPQDVFYWFAYLMSKYEARDKAWSWMVDNWDWIEKTYSGDKSYDIFPRYAGARLMTRHELEQFEVFFTPKLNVPALRRAIEVGIKDIESRVEWVERDKKAVIDRLNNI